MKKRILITAGILLWSILSLTASADDKRVYIEPVKMRVTCYLPTGNKTADGTVPYEGICAAKREWIGKVAVLYDMDMQYLGCWEIRDTGGHARIKNGTSVDLFMENMEHARAWIAAHGDYCFVQIIEAEG